MSQKAEQFCCERTSETGFAVLSRAKHFWDRARRLAGPLVSRKSVAGLAKWRVGHKLLSLVESQLSTDWQSARVWVFGAYE